MPEQPGLTGRLDELLANVENVSIEEIPALLIRLGALSQQLAARLIMANGNGPRPDPKAGAGKLLDVEEAAERTGMSEDWLYRHASTLPFTVKVGRSLRFSETGLVKWIA